MTSGLDSTIQLLSPLLGLWQGTGRGIFPTIVSFDYSETMHFELDVDRRFLHYHQRTERRNDGEDDFIPSHWESGFIIPTSASTVTVSNTQSGGRIEVLDGVIYAFDNQLQITLTSKLLAQDDRIIATSRVWRVTNERFQYTMSMYTNMVPALTNHLQATLTPSTE